MRVLASCKTLALTSPKKEPVASPSVPRNRPGLHRQRLKAIQSPVVPGSLAETVRPDFPILQQTVNGKPLIYFDNAATSHKPKSVMEAMDNYYTSTNSNVHRGVHALSAEATALFENARSKVCSFINGSDSREVVFTRNATEAINLVAHGWAMHNLKMGDEILVSVAEHHSNLIPWHIVAKRTGAQLKYISLTPDTEELSMEHFNELLTDRTKLVSTFHVSNVLASKSPVEEIAQHAHKLGAKVLLDCCQAVPNMPVDVRQLGADWIVASGHKMCGPTGCGFLWGKYEVLDEMEPFMGGGEMIEDVFLDRFTFAEPPAKFEAGTPAIAEAIGLGAACDYLSGIGMNNIHGYEQELGDYLYDKMSSMKQVKVYGPPPSHGRGSLCAFNVDGVHSTDLAMVLDQYGVAIRSGHHCAQPLHRYFKVSSSARASLYFYNTKSEIDLFCDALEESIQFFK